jgi:hypothetical protein
MLLSRPLVLLFVLAYADASTCPSNVSGYEQNTDFKNHDMSKPITNMTSPMECCSLCAITKGCTAISFGPYPKYGCRLKTSDAGRVKMDGRYSYLLHPPAPTPAPRPTPAPQPTPVPVPLTEIHVVSSNHFDGGCKIGGCQADQPAGWKDPIWPPNCAKTMHGPGQPHAYHVVNRYVPARLVSSNI